MSRAIAADPLAPDVVVAPREPGTDPNAHDVDKWKADVAHCPVCKAAGRIASLTFDTDGHGSAVEKCGRCFLVRRPVPPLLAAPRPSPARAAALASRGGRSRRQ